MTVQRARLLEGPIVPTLAALSAPNIVASLLQSGQSVVEAAYLGLLGTVELAAVALVFPFFMLMTMLSAGAVGGAVAGATARALGAGDHARAEAVLRAAILIALVLSTVMAAVILGFGRMIFTALGGQGEVLAAAMVYADRLFAGIAAIWLFNMMASVLRGSGDTVRPAFAIAAVLSIYAATAALLIFGLELGIAGAGFALPVAYGIGAAGLAAWILSGRAGVQARLGGVPLSVLGPLARQGGLAAVQSTLTILMALVVTAIVGRLGTVWLAGYGIGVRLELLLIPVIFGIGGALIAMVGINVGAGQRDRAIRVAWTGAFAAALVVGVIGLVGAVAPALWGGLFTEDPDVLAAVTGYLRIVGPAYGFFGLGLALYFASQGLDSLAWPVIGTAVRLILVMAGGFGLLAFDLATPDLVFAVVAGAMAVYGLFVALSLRFGPWRPADPALRTAV